ncbi:unnamed protein product [Cylicostephanus goldi]|uniref:Uncharacterized protein n=1 Tax=Cylicostephanus goldi TaxID=71465 RepID=A0A3P6QKR2_CYLGO|nr:unnamed protein product [Cylicostephanus goldi]
MGKKMHANDTFRNRQRTTFCIIYILLFLASFKRDNALQSLINLTLQPHSYENPSQLNFAPFQDRHSSPRRVSHPTDGMTSLSTSYTAALAANTNPARHERYAAHIPVNKGDNSGRQSTASQDSQQRLVRFTQQIFL